MRIKVSGTDGVGLAPFVSLPAQKRLFRAMWKQSANGQPVRVIVLKPRKVGISTYVQGLFYWLSKNVPHRFCETVAHSAESTGLIFEVTSRIRRYDPHREPRIKTDTRRELAYGHDSRFLTQTAGGEYVGSGGTINYLHLSELAKWGGYIQDQLASLMNAVPTDPDSIVVIESTANRRDPTGEFESRFRAAVEGVGGYAPVFVGWWEDPRYVRPDEEFALDDATDSERKLMAELGLTSGQMAWRRWQITTTFNGSEIAFRQEFPATWEEAFSVARGRVFPMLNAATHNLIVKSSDLTAWRRYRGIDWGGAHPFVCVWVAHAPGNPGFTVDIAACPNTWRQLTTWSRREDGASMGQFRPLGDDAVDAIRYVIMTFGLTGHVHVYRELFVVDAAEQGFSDLDLCQQILRASVGEMYEGNVADRSRPNTILLYAQQGLPCQSSIKLETTIIGEVEDGVATMQALMRKTVPLIYPPRPEPVYVRARRLRRTMPFPIGETDPAVRRELARRAGERRGFIVR